MARLHPFSLFALVFCLAAGAWAQAPSGSEALAQGKAAATRGDYAAALPLFRRAAATLDAGQQDDAYLWAALAAERLGHQDEAERYKDLALAPARPEPLDTLPVEPVPVAAPAAAPAPEAEAPEAPQAKPDAFRHLFGRKEAKAPPKDEPAKAPDEKAEEKGKKDGVKDKPEVDAFQYFFGRREKKEEKAEPADSSEKPPV
jgi:hypothetical protein